MTNRFKIDGQAGKVIFSLSLASVAFFLIDDYKVFSGVFLMIWANNISR